MGLILLIILVVLLLGAVPAWPYNRGGPRGEGSWGYGPSGMLGLILIVVLILVLLGRI